MDSEILTLTGHGQPAFEALARLKSGDAALLYALAAAQGGRCTLEAAQAVLELDGPRARRAADALRLAGLARLGQPPREPQPQHPADIAQTRESDPAFQGLCAYLETELGRVLRKAELETLHHVYGTLGLPAEVLVLIIGECRERGRLSAREIEKQAYRWHDAGVTTYEQAEAFLGDRRQRRAREWAIRRLLGISERQPSETERKYLEKWAQEDLSDPLISLAYDRTVGRTGRLSWAYMDKILQSWRQQGFETAEAVAQGDRPPAKAAPSGPGAKAQSVEAAVLARYGQRRLEREAAIKARLAEVGAAAPDFAPLEARRRLCASSLARAQGANRQALEAELSELAQQRQGILARLGKPEDYLDDRPDCPKCGDRGYIGSQMCTCFQAACADEARRREGQA